jgi:N-acetylglutamate synthase-like GNAT family acetyltransferase
MSILIFFLYQGTQILGYAHIQFLPDQRSAIHIIAVDKNQPSQRFGSQFLALIEKWLHSLGIKSAYTEFQEKQCQILFQK